jgi:hypothetical protein
VNRLILTKLHLIFAAFMFPAVLMFLATGALYTWGNKGEWRENTQLAQLAVPYADLDEAGLRDAAVTALTVYNLPEPSGSTSTKGDGESRTLEWTGARSEASVVAADDPMFAEVTVREATFHRWLVQLHKAKGSTAFKLYATLLAAVLFLLVASGVVMGLQAKPLRRLTIASSVAGTAAFAGFVLLG